MKEHFNNSLYTHVPLHDFDIFFGTFSAKGETWWALCERNRLTLSQTSPGYYVFALQVFLKTLCEKEKLLVTSNFSFSPTVLYPFGQLSAILIKLKLSSANSFSLEESKICRSGRVKIRLHRTCSLVLGLDRSAIWS